MTDRSTTWVRLEREALDLVERALERPTEEQRAWIEEQATESTALRHRSLELLKLAGVESDFDEPEGHLDPEAISDAPTRSISPDAPEVSPSPHHRGELIGNYKVDQEIGRGGMGVVYRAHRADQSFDLAVALKVMQSLPGVAARRFEAERQILARLDHPNIARILDGGHTEKGSPYLVMELAEGQPIDDHCNEQELSTDDRIALFLEVCDAVTHAHRRLVVHRDLKPGNVLVTNDGRVKLLDFGIAKLIEVDGEGKTITQFGLGAMTPEYASPEQVRHEPITVSTDVYSLGVILFELLTGQRPYQLEDRSPSNIERVVCDSTPPRPSTLVRTLDKSKNETFADQRGNNGDLTQRSISGDLDAIVLTALEKDPNRRYSSVEAFADDLRRLLDGRPVAAQPHTWAYVTRRFLQRHRARVVLAATVLAITLFGIGFGIFQSLRAAEEGRRALLEARKLERTNEFLNALFVAPDPMYGMGKDTTVRELLATAVDRLQDEELSDEAPSLLRSIGQSYSNLGLTETAAETFELAEQQSLRAFGEDHIDTARSRSQLANVVSDLGESERAVELLEKALATFESQPQPPDDLDVVRAQMATALSYVGEVERAEEMYKGLVESQRRLSPTLDFANVLNNYGVMLMQDNRRAEGNALMEEAIEVHRAVTNDSSPMLAIALANVAGFAANEKDYERSERLFKESIELSDELLGQDHPQTMTTRASLVDLYHRTDRLDDAGDLASSLLSQAEAALPANHPILAYAQVVFAGVRIDQERGAEIEQIISEAIESRRQSFPADHWLVASAENRLGASWIQQGRFKEAQELLERTYQTLLQALGEDHEQVRKAADYLERARARQW